MFITMSSAVIVALALVAQATSFDSRFQLFALLLLPLLLLLGLATFVHLGEANGFDVRLVISMNRLRPHLLSIGEQLECAVQVGAQYSPPG